MGALWTLPGGCSTFPIRSYAHEALAKPPSVPAPRASARHRWAERGGRCVSGTIVVRGFGASTR